MHKAWKTFSHLLTRSILSALSFSFRLIAKPTRNLSEHGVAGVPSGELSDSQLRTLLLKRKNKICSVCSDRSEGAKNGLVVSTVLYNCNYHIHENKAECPSRYFIVI